MIVKFQPTKRIARQDIAIIVLMTIFVQEVIMIKLNAIRILVNVVNALLMLIAVATMLFNLLLNVKVPCALRHVSIKARKLMYIGMENGKRINLITFSLESGF